MHAAGNTDALLDRDARGQDTRRVNTIYHFLSDYPLILITPASVAASRKVEREQASAAEKGQPKKCAYHRQQHHRCHYTSPFSEPPPK
jgi:hypothetical protein